MAIESIRPLAVAVGIMLFAASVFAQDLEESSLSPSGAGDTALGADIGDEAKKIVESVPELREADRKRDTKTRGSFVGADTGGKGLFESKTKGDGKTPGTRRQQRPGSREAYQPRPGGPQTQRGRARQTRGRTLRPRLALGFHYTPKFSPGLVENVRASLKRVASLNKNPSIRVSVEKNIVILTGTVANAHDRALSEQLVALSPGVYKIDNRLKVASADSPSPETGR